jgi:hypothetical protein
VILALDKSPPFEAPLRFFLSAPLYGIATGVVLMLRSDTVSASRWSFDTFAVVHLMALGFMAQVMAGALLQLLPVVVGTKVPATRWVATATHLGLNAGTLLLAGGFLTFAPRLLAVAAPLLLATFVIYLGALSVALVRAKAKGPTLLALRAAAVGLATTVGLGFTLASSLSGAWPLPIMSLVHVHAAWGLLGFATCLYAGVAYVVVPMFQLTAPYPKALARAVPVLLLAGGVCAAGGVFFGVSALSDAGAAAFVIAVVVFATKTLELLGSRKRRVRDAMFWSLRLGLWCLLLAVAPAACVYVGVPPAIGSKLEYLTGVLLLCGAFPAFIEGMLYKILPFLVWLHASRGGGAAPLMNEVVGDAGPKRQLWVHSGALVLLVAGVASPLLVALGGAAFAASHVLLSLNLLQGVRVYRAARPA